MNLSDLLVSYKQVESQPSVKRHFDFPEFTYQREYDSPQNAPEQIEQEIKETPKSKYSISRELFATSSPNQPVTYFSPIKGSQEFESAYDEVEKINPEAKKYRRFLTQVAKIESGFNKRIQNRAGAPAYGYFQFMQDGKKYNNISKYANTDIETFRNNPQLQIQAAIKLAKSFENSFTANDLKIAKDKGFTTFGLLGGAWLGGVGGVRKYLNNQGDPSDSHWGGKGSSVGKRIRQFNYKYGGSIKS